MMGMRPGIILLREGTDTSQVCACVCVVRSFVPTTYLGIILHRLDSSRLVSSPGAGMMAWPCSRRPDRRGWSGRKDPSIARVNIEAATPDQPPLFPLVPPFASSSLLFPPLLNTPNQQNDAKIRRRFPPSPHLVRPPPVPPPADPNNNNKTGQGAADKQHQRLPGRGRCRPHDPRSPGHGQARIRREAGHDKQRRCDDHAIARDRASGCQDPRGH